MFTFQVSPAVLQAFPSLVVQALPVSGVQEALKKIDTEALLNDAIAQLAHAVPIPEELTTHPTIAAWREGYRALGVKPSSFKASVEALAKRALAGKTLATHIPLVDFYNAHSLMNLACLGGYDRNKIAGRQMQIRFCQPETDSFTPLGGTSADFPLTARLLIYAMDSEVCCWSFNCRDSIKTALDAATDHALFFAESLNDDQQGRAQQALQAMAATLSTAGATVGPLCVAQATAPAFSLEDAPQTDAALSPA